MIISEVVKQTHWTSFNPVAFRNKLVAFEGRRVRVNVVGYGFGMLLQGVVKDNDIISESLPARDGNPETLGGFFLQLRKYDGPFTVTVTDM